MHSFQINNNLDNILILGFADYTTIKTRNLESVTVLVEVARDLFSLVEMQIYSLKSPTINIEKKIYDLIPIYITNIIFIKR